MSLSSAPWSFVLASVLVTLGLLCLQRRPAEVVGSTALLAGSVVLWALFWRLAAPLGLGFLGLGREWSGPDIAVVVNAATALLAWLPVGIGLRLIRRNVRGGWLYRSSTCSAWVVGVIVPSLGQGGRWPWQSLVLLGWVAALTALMGTSATGSKKADDRKS